MGHDSDINPLRCWQMSPREADPCFLCVECKSQSAMCVAMDTSNRCQFAHSQRKKDLNEGREVILGKKVSVFL